MHVVLGASGTLGRPVVRRLLAEREPVRAVSRNPARITDLVDAGAEAVVGDLLTAGWMPGALEGARSVTVAAHGLVPPDRRNHPEAVDGRGVRRLMDEAVRAGVEHVVYLSAASGGEATRFVRIKRATEAHLRASGVGWTILRPTVFVENHALVLMGEPLRDTGRVTFFGRGRTPLNWISVEDVAGEVVRALGEPASRGAVRELGGPDVLSRLQVLEILERAIGKKARRRHVPLLAVRTMQALAGPWHPGLRVLLEMAAAEETGSGPVPTDPGHFDATGRVTVADVIEDWARSG